MELFDCIHIIKPSRKATRHLLQTLKVSIGSSRGSLGSPARMPDPSLQAYLAQHYMSGPKADAILARQSDAGGSGEDRKLKKKRKQRRGGDEDGSSRDVGGLKFQDESDAWKAKAEEEEDSISDAQVVKQQRQQSFKKGGWTALQSTGQAVTSARAADADAAPDSPDEAPQLAGADGVNLDATAADLAHAQRQEEAETKLLAEQSSSGPSQPMAAPSGLKTKEQVRAERLAREEQERRDEAARKVTDVARARDRGDAEEDEEARQARLSQTTVYRDERGRRIDVRAEEEAAKAEEELRRRREREKKEWNRGERQREEDAKRRRELDRVKSEGVARYADDARMNEELRSMERADDPALAFLTKKRSKGPQLPKYKGPPPPPNRFGIPPGHRWDGVVRGNGFEKKLFEAKGQRIQREQARVQLDQSMM